MLQGATRHGWPSDLRTADRVTRLIRRPFGVTYHPEHVRWVLKKRRGFSSQKPQTRAREQNDKAVTPTVGRTLAPRGQTPILPAWQRHARISAIRCLTRSPAAAPPELYFELLPEGLNGRAEDVVAFLRDLRRELPGPLTVIWDRNNTPSKSKVVQAYRAMQKDLVREELPAYAPALNPDAMLWAWLK